MLSVRTSKDIGPMEEFDSKEFESEALDFDTAWSKFMDEQQQQISSQGPGSQGEAQDHSPNRDREHLGDAHFQHGDHQQQSEQGNMYGTPEATANSLLNPQESSAFTRFLDTLLLEPSSPRAARRVDEELQKLSNLVQPGSDDAFIQRVEADGLNSHSEPSHYSSVNDHSVDSTHVGSSMGSSGLSSTQMPVTSSHIAHVASMPHGRVSHAQYASIPPHEDVLPSGSEQVHHQSSRNDLRSDQIGQGHGLPDARVARTQTIPQPQNEAPLRTSTAPHNEYNMHYAKHPHMQAQLAQSNNYSHNTHMSSFPATRYQQPYGAPLAFQVDSHSPHISPQAAHHTAFSQMPLRYPTTQYNQYSPYAHQPPPVYNTPPVGSDSSAYASEPREETAGMKRKHGSSSNNESQTRIKHVNSEKKRRAVIKDLFTRMCDNVPAVKSAAESLPKSSVLQYTLDHMKSMRAANDNIRTRLENSGISTASIEKIVLDDAPARPKPLSSSQVMSTVP